MRALLLLTLALSCGRGEAPTSQPRQEAPPGKASTMSTPAEPDEQRCIDRFEMDSNRSVLEEQRSLAGAKRWDDFPERYAAAYLDPDAQKSVRVVEEHQIGDTPLLWFTADGSEAVVNAAVLTDLVVVDATRLAPGTRVEIGGLTELGHGKIAPRDLVRFLVQADVVRTYAHIGSSVCLSNERRGEDGDFVDVTGEHTYFTNEENVDPFALVVHIDGRGRISATGIAAR